MEFYSALNYTVSDSFADSINIEDTFVVEENPEDSLYSTALGDEESATIDHSEEIECLPALGPRFAKDTGETLIGEKNKQDTLVGGNGKDILKGEECDDRLEGGSQDDRLEGGNGDDLLIGGIDNDIHNSDKDTLFGGNGNDSLVGNNDNDSLVGGLNDDTLEGGSGKDTLTGSDGVDTFVYDSYSDSLLANFDRITDLNIGADFIDGPNPVAAGNINNLSNVQILNQAGIQAVLQVNNFGAGDVATFTFGNQTFLAFNDGFAGFQAASDAIIDITGYQGNLNNLAII